MQNLILDCDDQIKIMLNDWIGQDETKKALYIDAKVHKKINKNTPENIDLNLISYQFLDGLDLYSIEGFRHGLALTIMCETGEQGIRKFPTAQHFSSWLRLSPNNKISEGGEYSAVAPLKEAIDSKSPCVKLPKL